MRINDLHCMHCGQKYSSDVSPLGDLAPCASCEQEPVDLPTLLSALNILDLTIAICSRCQHTSPIPNQYCYHCGAGLASQRAS